MSKIALATLIALMVASTTLAQGLQGDGMGRRIGVPSGAGPRITVQIDPNARIARPAAPTGPQAAGSQGGAASGAVSGAGTGGGGSLAQTQWFWNVISPVRADSRPGRLQDALRLMANAPEARAFTAPRVQGLQDVARLYGREILAATVGTKVSPALVLSVISVESAGEARAVSRAGAQGLMQLMPATAERFGVTNPLDAGQNIRGGVAYLDWLLTHFDGDPILALAGYNAGEGSVRDNNGVPPYAETRAYVPKVITAWSVARGLCQTPPELMSDGCVFSISNL